MTRHERVGFPLLRDTDDSPLSSHFGKAKWLGIYEVASGEMRFLRNSGLNGGYVAEVFAHERCTAAVFANIGAGALEHLKARGIESYWGRPEISAKDLVPELLSGSLPRATEGHGHGGEHGCSH